MENKKQLKNKKESGITLIALSITIIVLSIIIGISFELGTSSIKEARENKLITELGMINHAVLERYAKQSLTGEEYPGVKITEKGIDLNDLIENKINTEATEEITRKDSNDDNYYYLTNENGGLRKLGIKDTEDEYIVNYETGEVINYTKKVTESGKPLYIYSVNKTK